MSKLKHRTKLQVFQMILVLALLSFLILLLGTETARVAAEVGKETVRVETVTETLSAVGYLFREEIPVTDRNGGAVHYLVANGKDVSAGASLAEVYRADSGVGERARAAALYEEIELLQAALSENEEEWKLAYWRANELVSEAASRGDVNAAARATELARLALMRKDAGENHVFFEARIKECEAQLAQMLQHVGAPNTVLAPASGVFYSETDGYERTFTVDATAGLTPEGLRELIAERPTVPAGEPEAVGKIVPAGRYVLAVSVQAQSAMFLVKDKNYWIVFEDGTGEHTVGVTLGALNYSEDKNEVLLLFEGMGELALFEAGRCRNVRIEGEAVTGLSIPETAMRVENNRDGVYILSDGRAAWRPVKILYRANGGCLVAPVEPAEGDPRPALAEGDILIVTTRRVYEGKELS